VARLLAAARTRDAPLPLAQTDVLWDVFDDD